jgi:hypothetical protein
MYNISLWFSQYGVANNFGQSPGLSTRVAEIRRLDIRLDTGCSIRATVDNRSPARGGPTRG